MDLFPNDILIKIFLLLTNSDLVNINIVSKKFNQTLKHQPFWVTKLKKDFNIKYLDVNDTYPNKTYKFISKHHSIDNPVLIEKAAKHGYVKLFTYVYEHTDIEKFTMRCAVIGILANQNVELFNIISRQLSSKHISPMEIYNTKNLNLIEASKDIVDWHDDEFLQLLDTIDDTKFLLKVLPIISEPWIYNKKWKIDNKTSLIHKILTNAVRTKNSLIVGFLVENKYTDEKSVKMIESCVHCRTKPYHDIGTFHAIKSGCLSKDAKNAGEEYSKKCCLIMYQNESIKDIDVFIRGFENFVGVISITTENWLNLDKLSHYKQCFDPELTTFKHMMGGRLHLPYSMELTGGDHSIDYLRYGQICIISDIDTFTNILSYINSNYKYLLGLITYWNINKISVKRKNICKYIK